MLYKYLPERFARALVDRGEALFRTLSFFRAAEHAARGDEIEGVHVDAPEHDVTLANLTRGGGVTGRFRMLNSVNQELVYAFCCSLRFDETLFSEFECDTCVVIRDIEEFVLRCRTAASRACPIDRPAVLHRPVAYFDPTRQAPLDMKDPQMIPFLKHFSFANQAEYRAVFARKGGLTVLSRIVQPNFTFEEEIRAASTDQKRLTLGRLSHIAELVHRGA